MTFQIAGLSDVDAELNEYPFAVVTGVLLDQHIR